MSDNKSNILVLAGPDDFELVCGILSEHYAVHQADSRANFTHNFDPPIDVILCDLCVVEMGCEELMREWHSQRPTTPFILLADADAVPDAIEAMKHGAADYVAKPINKMELVVRIAKWIEAGRKDERLMRLESRIDGGNGDTSRRFDIPTGISLEELERAAVERALQQHRGNRTHAAKTLGISVRTLQRKLKAWHVPVFALQHQPSRSDFSMPMFR